ncbi:MAG TPA: pseudouridine synthase [Thermoanaerobaculia bacterium]|nr:pseudouridine synthase [Thermoanaerobaculia bacterium]
MQADLGVLYRDEDLLVVDKPAGIAVHRGWAHDREFALTLARRLAGRHVYPVHRLDRGTSGALLLALTPEIASRLAAGFETGRVHKRYLALVRGVPPESGVIEHPLPRSPGGPRVSAVTEFRRLGTFERYALLEVVPLTGRLHQIRRHLKHLSHPLIGDVRYGKGEHNRLFRSRFGLHRLALHAFELAFEHPRRGVPLRVRAPLPEDLAGPLRAMGLTPQVSPPVPVLVGAACPGDPQGMKQALRCGGGGLLEASIGSPPATPRSPSRLSEAAGSRPGGAGGEGDAPSPGARTNSISRHDR